MVSPSRSELRPTRCAGSGSIDNMPLNAHVTAPAPNTRPMFMCHRFQPRYGIAVARPLCRYRLRGDSAHAAITIPSNAVALLKPEDQMTSWLHCRPCLRIDVKYNQCGIGPTYAPQ